MIAARNSGCLIRRNARMRRIPSSGEAEISTVAGTSPCSFRKRPSKRSSIKSFIMVSFSSISISSNSREFSSASGATRERAYRRCQRTFCFRLPVFCFFRPILCFARVPNGSACPRVCRPPRAYERAARTHRGEGPRARPASRDKTGGYLTVDDRAERRSFHCGLPHYYLRGASDYFPT
jgi:hypothetical protein